MRRLNAGLVMILCIGLALTVWLEGAVKIHDVRMPYVVTSPSPYPVTSVIVRPTPGPTVTVRATTTAHPRPAPTVTVTSRPRPSPTPTCLFHQIRKCP